MKASKPRLGISLSKLTQKGLMSCFKIERQKARVLLESILNLQKTGANHFCDELLDACNKALDGHGVEAIRGDWHDGYFCDIVALYVNMGDTYDTTVVFDTVSLNVYVTSYGDFVEKFTEEYKIE